MGAGMKSFGYVCTTHRARDHREVEGDLKLNEIEARQFA